MPGRSKNAKSGSRPSQSRQKLDWKAFHLLENMLVFCSVPEMSVPNESGVQFRISRIASDGAVCLLFHIDRESDPLIQEAGRPRPDYLALYITAEVCIFTIIEMKGTTEKGAKRGIEQITTFRDRLRGELNEHLPRGLKAKFQGILLCPYNADIPRQQIAKEADNGFVILALQYHQKAELFPYISKQNDLTEKYRHEALAHSDKFGFIEGLLAQGAMSKRIQDTFYKARFVSKNRSGLYINYALSEQGEYAVWLADGAQNVVAVKAESDTFLTRLREGLAQMGLNKAFEVQRLE